jgi:hypothetical protein
MHFMAGKILALMLSNFQRNRLRHTG